MLRILMVLMALMPALAWSTDEGGPRQVVVSAVDRMLSRIEEERSRLEAEPEYAREVVRAELDGLVDFKRITQLVMAEFFEKASREQKYRFLDVFRDSLINTYATGITLYEGQQIRVLPMQDGDIRGNRARVQTELVANDGQVIPVYFSLYQTREGTWMVENVIVNGLNLGKTFRAQFAQAAQQYDGDIDQIISHWSSELEVEKKDGQDGGQSPAETAGQDAGGA